MTVASVGGPASTYAYYSDGSLDTLTWSVIAQPFKYTYRLDGQYDVLTFPNGQTRTYAYDDQGRLLQAATALGSTNLATYAYGYDVDNATGLFTKLGQRSSLTANVPTQGLASALTKFYYDSVGQLTRADYPTVAPFNSEIDSWTYDAIGNRLSSVVNGTTQSYAYFKNGANPLNGTRLSSDGVNSYVWDANGSNLTRSGAPGTFTFGFTFDNRLSAITGSTTASYTYDYQGRRTSKTVNGSMTSYVYDDLNLVSETTGGIVRTYAFGPGVDEPLVVNQGGTISYVNVDGLSSVVGTTSATGVFDYSSIFDTWGVVRSETVTRTSSFTYTGRELGEVGFAFYRARFLQPAVGKFSQEDPKGLGGGDPNVYAYVSGNPVRYRDPLGHYRVYGNWCGPDWTGGLVEEYNPLHDQRYKPAIDAIDAACEKHDKCYFQCRREFACTTSKRRTCMHTCNWTLEADLSGLRGGAVGLAMEFAMHDFQIGPGANASGCACNTPTPAPPAVVPIQQPIPRWPGVGNPDNH